MVQKHIVKAYDKDLAELDRLLAEMAGQALDMLAGGLKSFMNYDTVLAKSIIASDQSMNDLEMQVDRLAAQLVALRQPMGEDLRTIIASIRISSDLERMADYAKNIAKRTKMMAASPKLQGVASSVDRMALLVNEMISNVISSYIDRDSLQALKVIQSDDAVDRIHESLFRELLTYMMEAPANITECTHFLFVSKNIERIGDHATNMAEQVYYVVEGRLFDEDAMDLAALLAE